MPTTPPTWEHGHRCHGLWQNGQRIAFIGLTPPGFSLEYARSLDIDQRHAGTTTTLRVAKRQVEKAIEILQSDKRTDLTR